MTILGRGLAAPMSVLAAAAAIAVAAPAQADPDVDFANQLHSFGIYGQRDYNAWLGKITCKRLYRGVDGDAYASMSFIGKNLPRDTPGPRWPSSSAPRSAPTARIWPECCRGWPGSAIGDGLRWFAAGWEKPS